MKYLIFLILISANIGYSQGIVFNDVDLEKLKALAKDQDRLIYIDAYTSWCGPCKMMKKNTFTDPSVGRFYNDHFINAAYDMEKGEGLKVADMYKVMAYPTHLVINADGKIMHRGLGYMDPEDFLIFGTTAIDPEKRLGTLDEKFESGYRDESFLKNYIKALADANDPRGEVVANEYLATQSDLTTPDHLELLYNYGMNPKSPNHKYVLANKEKLTDKYQTGFLAGLAFAYYGQGVKDRQTATQTIEKISTVYPAEKDILEFYIKSMDYQRAKDQVNYEKTLSQYLTKGKYERFSYDELNQFAWTIFENSKNKKVLKQALSWALESVKKRSEYANNDTVANLYFAVGDKKNAKIYAEKAIELGKQHGEDTSSTEELLNKL